VTQFLSYVLPGVPYGCTYALMAVGLVLTYRASGVFNLAFGAQAYVSAVVFSIAVHDGWPVWAAFVVAVVTAGPAIGLVVERFLFRYTRTAGPLVKLVPALGLLIAIPSITQMAIGTATRVPAALVLNPEHVYFHLASSAVSGEELSTTVVTVVVVAALAVLLRSRGLGLRMRAVVESPRMAELAGVQSDRTSAVAWALSSLFAGLAGVLLAPIYAQLGSSDFTALLVAAIAAAAVGGFESLPLTLAGGIGLGVVQEVIGGYLPSGTILSSGLRPAFPFVVLAVVLVARGTLRHAGAVDPLASCDPPTVAFRPPSRLTEVAVGSRTFGVLAAGLLVAVTLLVVPGNWEFVFTQGVVLAIIFLSITLLTGMGGQISLCQAAFAGAGAFTAGQLAMHFGTSVLLGTVLGGLLAAALGALVALPTLRLGGIAVGLLTLSFALVADNVLFLYPWAGNGATGLSVPRPVIGSVSFAGNGAFFWLVLAVLAVLAGAVKLLQGGTFGQELAALRGSEKGSAAIGVDVLRLRVVVFALSAGIAGIGGALYASLEQSVSPNDFNYQFSLVYVVVVAAVGVYSVAGAVEAGVLYAVLLQLVSTLSSRFSSLLALVFGLAALTYVRHSEGVVAHAKAWTLDRAEQLTRYLRRGEVMAPVVAPAVVGAGEPTPVGAQPVAGEGAGEPGYPPAAREAEHGEGVGTAGPRPEQGREEVTVALLRAEGITKCYGDQAVLSDVSLEVREGEAVGVVGPNGAGKTTLFDCVLGVVRSDAGTVWFDGVRIDGMASFRRSQLGIGRTFQRLEMFSGMTPMEHLLVAERARSGAGRLWKDAVGLGRPRAGERRVAAELLELVGLTDVADVAVGRLSLGRCRLVELARALVGPPRLLMLDEPSSGLDDHERATLMSVLGRVRREPGMAVVMVEHDLGLVTAVVDRLVVLDVGRVIADGPVENVLADPAVRRAYLGAGR
jgi:ABC-type branched-subunit amino acid transport system ATPase component/branched-subunit amino acid ABC-type transport system permease component